MDFLLTLYPILPGSTILDVGCGTGRHSIELAKRGYKPVGIDLSPAMLDQARTNSKTAGVEVDWIQADATTFTLDRKFDVAICLCEGAVGLVEQSEDAEAHDLAIFKNIAACLNPNAPFVMTALNGYSSIRQMTDEHIAEGRFDTATMVANYEDIWELPEGAKAMKIYERLFIAPEVVKMLTDSGFVVDNVYGGTAGHWARRRLMLDEVEAMFVCRKA